MWGRVLLAGVLLGGMAGGCAVVDPVDSRYDTVSRSLAKARNEGILLNLVRASHDYPLSFTTIANVSPGLTNISSFALPNFMFGPRIPLSAAAAATSAAPLFSPGRDVIFNNTTAANATTVSTNFNVSTLETGAFYQGFLRPIDLRVLDYFVRQDYPPELLFWLFTDSFEITINGQTYGYRYSSRDYGCSRNDPGPVHRCFVDWVRLATIQGLTVEVAAARAGDGGSGSKPMTYARFCYDTVSAERARRNMGEERYKWISDRILLKRRNPKCGGHWSLEKIDQPQLDTLSLTDLGSVTLKIIPRSAYGVFVFLGSVIRLETDRIGQPNNVPPGRLDAVAQPPRLWTVRDDATMMDAELIKVGRNGGGHCFSQTWFEDGDYCVPDDATTTKRIFGLLAQLIAIQTQAGDLATTPIVRTIQ